MPVAIAAVVSALPLFGCSGSPSAKSTATATSSPPVAFYAAQYQRIEQTCLADNSSYAHEPATTTTTGLKAARVKLQGDCVTADDALLRAGWPAYVLTDIKAHVTASETFEAAFVAGTATTTQLAAAEAADRIVAGDLGLTTPTLATVAPTPSATPTPTPSAPTPTSTPKPRIVGTPPTVTNWALQSYPMDCSGVGYLVLQVSYADLTGDGVPDAVVLVRCNAGAGSPPVGLFVFDGATSVSSPRMIATLISTDRGLQGNAFTIGGTTIAITVYGFSSTSVPHCCPDETLHLSWTWHDGTYTQN